MPVYRPEQPPLTEPGSEPERIPGHPDPTGTARRRSPRPARSDTDAAEIAAWQKAQERTKRRAKLRANQRKARVIQRQRPGDGIPLTDPEPLAARRSGGERRASLAVAGALLLAAAGLLGYVFTGFGLGSDSGPAVAVDPAAPGAELIEPDLAVGADIGPRGIEALALSTVQLVGLNDDLEPECAGSGVIVGSDGTILTNAHVVTSEEGCEFTSIGVGVTVDSNDPAVVRYRADVLVVDLALDLAVLRISQHLDPASVEPLPAAFRAAPLGDSDTVELGDDVRILGYPVIGGETITLTTGSVSGFTAQAGIGTRALIKTDATISAGNSGGMAVDTDGRVIGIPTKARASETGPAIDCRPLTDTNDDGAVDDADNCVPVGGFLNGVRPINLALPLLAAADSADPLGPVVESDEERFDFSQVLIENPRFSLGREENVPIDEVVTATAGISELCFFVDWQGIPVGSAWAGEWFVDGELEKDLGFRDQRWTIEEEGQNFWLCAKEQNALGLPAGVYEIGFFLEGMLLFVEGIELTEEPVEVVPVTWSNVTEGDICGLAVNPFADSGQVGLDELGADESIPPGASTTMNLPLGRVVVEAYDCDGDPVADAFGGLEIVGPASFLIGL